MPRQNKKPMHRVPFYRRPIVMLSCLVAIILIAVVIVLVVKAISKNDEQTDDSTTETENVLVYREYTDDEENDLAPEDQKEIVQYEGENPNNLDYLTGLITYTEISGGKLVAMVSIDQYLSDGVCVANLKKNSQVAVSKEQDIEADASTSHCGPIEIDLSGITGGKYQLEVVITGGDRTGTITSEVEF